MNGEYVQNLRYKLQKRVRRLNSLGFQSFQLGLRQFFNFVDAQPLLLGIIDEMVAGQPNLNEDADKIFSGTAAIVSYDEREDAALGWSLLRRCSQSDEPKKFAQIIRQYEHTGTKYDEMLEAFRDRFLEPFYEYVDEHLDDQRAVLAMLRRYKHKCEWFARERLYHLWETNTQSGERNLAKHLYEYLHDQGIDFHIEPRSISGEVDLIAAQKTQDPLIADAKIFDPGRSKGKPYIAKGFGQVYRYTVDFHEPFGYLVIYQTSEHDLRFALADKTQSTPFVVHNNKTIFLIAIDIYPHELSASKRGVLKPVEITEDDLIRVAGQIGDSELPQSVTEASAPKPT